MSYEISEECVACGVCAKNCPLKVIVGKKKQGFEIDPIMCMQCGTCFEICPKAAILDPYGRRRRGPSKKTKKLKATIKKGLCAGCQTCLLNCPKEAIRFVDYSLFKRGYCEVDEKLCIGCKTCTSYCIIPAIKMEEK